MDSKNLLILLVAIFAYVNVYQPLTVSNKRDMAKLTTYKQRLLSEKEFILHKDKISKFIKKSKITLENNEKILYSATQQDSIIFNTMQSKVKKLVHENRAKLLNILWGEPFSEEGSRYTNMPFTFIIEIEPKKFYNFFTKIFEHSKAISIKQLFIVKKKTSLVVNMQIYLHKNKKETNR